MSLTFWLLHASVLNTQGCLASALRVLSVLPTTALQAAKEAVHQWRSAECEQPVCGELHTQLKSTGEQAIAALNDDSVSHAAVSCRMFHTSPGVAAVLCMPAACVRQQCTTCSLAAGHAAQLWHHSHLPHLQAAAEALKLHQQGRRHSSKMKASA